MKHTFIVKGMHCRSCVALVTEALEDEGAKRVTVKLDEKNQIGDVSFESELPEGKLKEIIEEQGQYKVQ